MEEQKRKQRAQLNLHFRIKVYKVERWECDKTLFTKLVGILGVIWTGNQELIWHRENGFNELEMKNINWLDAESENEENAIKNCF